MNEILKKQENSIDNTSLSNEVFNKKVRIRPNINSGKFQGRYSKENQDWLEQNVGTIINAYRQCINYFKLENGFICHIYECSDVS